VFNSVIAAAERQVSAIVAKTMDALESQEALQSLHPMDFDLLRRTIIKAMWSTYTVGLKFGGKVNDNGDI
jgi:hypothetical protein